MFSAWVESEYFTYSCIYASLAQSMKLRKKGNGKEKEDQRKEESTMSGQVQSTTHQRPNRKETTMVSTWNPCTERQAKRSQPSHGCRRGRKKRIKHGQSARQVDLLWSQCQRPDKIKKKPASLSAFVRPDRAIRACIIARARRRKKYQLSKRWKNVLASRSSKKETKQAAKRQRLRWRN